MTLFSKNRIKIEDLVNDTMSLVQQKYNQAGQVFTVASAWGQIIFVLENLSQLILFFIEDSITELNINTAVRENSIYALAALAGHSPSRGMAAKGEIQITWNGKNAAEVGGGAVLIPNFSTLQCVTNGVQYLVNFPSQYARVNLNASSTLTATIIEGTYKEQKFTGTGLPLQTYNVSSKSSSSIDQYEYSVYINSTLWTYYDAITDIPRNGLGYTTKTSLSTGMDVIFGNGNFGLVPSMGSTITVGYIENKGTSGNIIVKDPSKLAWNFTSDGLDVFGNDVALVDVLNITSTIPPQLGANSEPIELTRLIAPRTSRNFVLGNADSYVIFFEKFGIFSIIEAFSTYNNQYIDDTNIVYLILVPDISQIITANETYFDVSLDSFTLTTDQRNAILKLIDDSGQKIISTEISIIEPQLSLYVINMMISIFEGYDPTTIKGDIISAMSNYFLTIRRRDKIPRSDLISIIETIAGVDSISLFFVSQKNEIYHTSNPSATNDVGLDIFGDIILDQNEITVISGGWSDRNNIYYNTGAHINNISSVNIDIVSITPVTYNTGVNELNISNLKTNITNSSL